jgi:hypothetical protein
MGAAMQSNTTRRRFLSLAGAALTLPGMAAAAAPGKRPKVAAIYTEFTHRSHAHVILENFLEPYLFNGERTDPGVEVVSFHGDQVPKGDMAADVARQYRIPIYKTIDEALCLGGKELAVDAVLSIGEHGRYPRTRLGQVEYPRKRFFDAIVAVLRRSGRPVPLFNDKHLSYRWDWAKEMYDVAAKLGIPFLAGSSVPLAERKPPLALPAGAPITEAVAVHGGGVESYDFHALEVLQSIVEFRKGGEAGVCSVEFLVGDALWEVAEKGWAAPLAEAALAADLGKKPATLRRVEGERRAEPHGVLLRYKDGLRALVLKVGRSSTRWGFACKLKGEAKPRATRFHVGPWQNRNLFKALSRAIQHHFRRGKAPYPVERTLLVTGVLDAGMRSRAAPGKAVATPHLEFGYAARDFTAMREMGESWKVVTEDTPEPRGIDLTGRDYRPK